MSIQSIIRWFEIAKPEPTDKDQVSQMAYHAEEFAEMMDAVGRTDMRTKAQDMHAKLLSVASFEAKEFISQIDDVALLDALCDQVVTAIGVGVLLGYDMERAITEVNSSNWTKFAKDQDGKYVPYIKPDGKIGKNPDTYQDPELEPFIDRKANQVKAREKLKELVSMDDTPAPYTSKKITVERIVTEVETYEIHPEQLGAFIDCADHRLEIDFGKPTGEFYSDKRRVLTTNGDQE